MTYEELLEKAREAYESEDTPHFFKAWLLANIIYPADESEDERIRKELIEFLKLPHSQFVGNREHEKWIAWLEKQGEKALNADEVIDWLDYNICNAYDYDGNDVSSTLKEKFIKDFKL